MAVICKKCGGAHPTWDCTASAAKIAAFAKSSVLPVQRPSDPLRSAAAPRKDAGLAAPKPNRGGSSAVEPRPSKPLVEGSTPSPRSKSTAGVHRPAPRSSGGRANPKTGDAASKDQVAGSNPVAGARKSASTKPSASPVEPITVIEVRDEGQIVERQALQEKRGRGRPKTIEDMRAYKAEKARKYRARAKEQPK